MAYDCGFAVPCESEGNIEGVGEFVTIKCEPNTNLINPYTLIVPISLKNILT